MATTKFTPASVKNLKFESDSDSKIQRHWDATARGLGIEVFKSGRKSWIYRYRIDEGKPNKTQRLLMLMPVNDMSKDAASDSLDDARLKVAQMAIDISAGIDPKFSRNAPVGGLTFDGLYQKFINDPYIKSKSENYQISLKSVYKNHLKKPLGDRTLTSIRRADMRDIINALIKKGNEGAARAVLSRSIILFSYALEFEYLEISPADHIKPHFTTSGKSDKWLDTDDKLVEAWNIDVKPQVRALVRLIMLTGLRRAEAINLKWTDIEGGVIHLEKSRVKTKNVFELPITKAMQKIFDTMKGNGSDFIFPSVTDNSKAIPAGSLHILLAPHGFTAHVLRHTVKSHLARLEVNLEGRSVVLNHSMGGMDDVYMHDQQLNLKKSVLDIWHGKLEELLKPDLRQVS